MTKTLDLSELLSELWYQLVLARELSSITCTDNHISCTQLIILKRLSESDVVSCKVLSSDLKIPPSTLTGIFNVLEKKGYVTRRYSTVDRRRVCVSLTSVGKAFLNLTRDSSINRLSAVSQTSNFDESDIERMTYLLQKFNHELQREISSAGF